MNSRARHDAYREPTHPPSCNKQDSPFPKSRNKPPSPHRCHFPCWSHASPTCHFPFFFRTPLLLLHLSSLDDLACRPPFLDGREVEGGTLPSLPSSVAPLPRRGHGTVGAVAMERSRHTDMPVREVDAQYVMPWPLWYPLYTCKTACVQGVLVGRWCTQGAMLAMDTSGERAP